MRPRGDVSQGLHGASELRLPPLGSDRSPSSPPTIPPGPAPSWIRLLARFAAGLLRRDHPAEPLVERRGSALVILPAARRLQAEQARRLRRAVRSLLAERPHVVLDLGGVTSIDSSGLAAILWACRRTESEGGSLRACRLTPPVRVLFELSRVHRVLDVHASLEEALEAAGDARPSAPASRRVPRPPEQAARVEASLVG